VVKAIPTNPDPCWQQPQAWLNAIDPLTGLTSKAVLGTVTTTVAGLPVVVPLSSKPTTDTKFTFGSDKTCSADKDCVRAVGATSDVQLTGGQDRGRLYWREVPGLRTKGY
jgi:Tfp pilus tip-associated adhesin PilY1